MPATLSGTSVTALAFSVNPPTGTPTVQAAKRKMPRAIGGSLSPIGYIVVTPASTVSFASTPTFSFVFAAGALPPSGSNLYVGLYDPTQASLGWTTFLGPGSLNGQTVSFASTVQPVTLQASVSYTFALFSTTQTLATPTPMPVSTTFPSGGSLAASFTTNYPSAARSAVFAFKPAAGGASLTNLVSLPSGCGSPPPCSVSLSAPVGSMQSIQALLYASANGTGTALAVGTSTASIFANQSTSLNFSLSGIMATFSVSLNPSTVTVGQGTAVQVTEIALDAAGEALGPGFVNESLATPSFSVSVTDPTGLSSIPNTYFAAASYSGVGSGPVTYTVQTPNYPPASASLNFNAAAPATATFAAGAAGYDAGCGHAGFSFCDAVGVYAGTPATAAALARQYILPPGGGHPRFDNNGVLWGVSPVGIKPDGTSAGRFALPGTLLVFDVSGNAYVADPTTNAVDVYSGNTLVRQINVTAAPVGAAVDPAGDVYVAFASGAAEYGPTGSGSISPIAVNASAGGAVATDGTGTVYALYNGAVGVWSAGTFNSAPARTLLSPYAPASGYAGFFDVGVDPAGDVYGGVLPASGYAYPVVYFQANSSTFSPLTQLQNDGTSYFAVPL